MNHSKKLLIIAPLISLSFFASSVFAAAPDGAGPWADSVISTGQGLMKDGGAVPAIRSNGAAALGVAENDTVEGNFYSLGFGGHISLGFDNGISSGAMIVEATNPGYPGETAKVEMSEDGTTWVMAGNVTADGTVNIPDVLSCAKFVRITDTSDPINFSDATADGYDVDGVQAQGESCSPSPSVSPSPSSSSTPAPSSNPGSSDGGTTSGGGGPSACTSSGVNGAPNIIDAHRTSPTSIVVTWGPNIPGINNFIVQYGFQNGNWQFSTNVSGYSTTINDLPANQLIWIHVAGTDNCVTGSYGAAVVVGGTALTNSPGFPNTGNPLSPGLPNTGIGPDDQNFLQFILSIFSRALNFKF